MSIRDEIYNAIKTDTDVVRDNTLSKYENSEDVNKFLVDLCGYTLHTFIAQAKQEQIKQSEEGEV